ncbi:Short-chain dehydrogenase/reductase SDR [Kalmanozyma brasiliensis GHG001]|uniref:NAD(P)-binding protein n=1 Tax=Kalmanozyma brasiliensis (strain GHG001) TaxID=1365824 RepID=V5GFB0_KALBG|nr:Short-chain dehydrogenase/reductase SDR [Kalmanozyma brasiliensis GHG001]EST04697.1 Short-chain dehydrogenase/reductase SDR [Kalmanozyma brasiliensis GHG001]
MVSLSTLTSKNASVDTTGQRALISGGTQGIGAGIALRFALSGASVWLVGRNENKANEVLIQLRAASAEAARRASSKSTAEHQFFQADLSSTAGVKKAASEISSKAGRGGVDYLIETQGGPPHGAVETNAEGVEKQFAVQVLSRVGLAKELVESGTIKRGVFMVAAPGQGGKAAIDVDDLDFVKAKAAGKWWSGPIGLIKKGSMASSVLDAANQHLAEQHPTLTFTHAFPGFVATEALGNQGHSSLLVLAGKIAGPIIGSKAGPGGYAELPFYLLANPEGQRYLETGNANLVDNKLNKLPLSKNVQDKTVRQQIWTKLTSYF